MIMLVNGSPEDVVGSLLGEFDEVVYAVDPSGAIVRSVVDVVGASGDPPSIRMLARREVLKEVTSDFIAASHAADLIANGVLELRTGPPDPGNEVLASGDRVVALVTAGSRVGALSTDDEGFVESVVEVCEAAWDDAEAFSLRTPPLSRIMATLEDDIGREAEADFEAILGSLETARGGGEGLDEVTISLLVAARNEELLYDISKWGEDAGIASKATFSRTKTELEEMGLLDTEKVPIDVGRPRLRLKFAHPRLAEASIDELASVARALMDA